MPALERISRRGQAGRARRGPAAGGNDFERIANLLPPTPCFTLHAKKDLHLLKTDLFGSCQCQRCRQAETKQSGSKREFGKYPFIPLRCALLAPRFPEPGLLRSRLVKKNFHLPFKYMYKTLNIIK